MVPQIDLLKRLVLSKFPITIIQTEDCDGVIELFEQLSRTEHRGFFYWNPKLGIHQLAHPEDAIEDTKTPLQALQCIEQSQHFGHFLLNGDMCDSLHNDECEATIQRILQVPDKSFRKVFIIGKQPNIPNHLKSKVIVIRLSTQYSGQI
ncbi:MAG: hypothetical protein HOM11_17640 [Methylococcales bacterium]|jgi:hypothetical protein|nr:hypothetical protein [Methylococcales bacterium]MBT7444911.1 hypothetical protein [Methylococcales bacterium]